MKPILSNAEGSQVHWNKQTLIVRKNKSIVALSIASTMMRNMVCAKHCTDNDRLYCLAYSHNFSNYHHGKK